MLELSNLSPPKGARKNRKRLGRGPGSGTGKTSGRGHGGQNSRSGGGVQPWFIGGSFPLALRLPKRGFTNIFRKVFQVVSLGSLRRLDGAEVTPESLKASGLIKSTTRPIKILADGKLDRALTFKDVAISKSAGKKIKTAGGSLPA